MVGVQVVGGVRSAQVAVNPEGGTVELPGEVDLDPEALYGRYESASGHRSSAGPFESL